MDASMFAGRLKELREQAGLTQQQLAVKAQLSQRAVSHWEQGLRDPTWPNVVALAEALGVDCRAFLEEPAERPDVGRGRPKKTEDASQADKPKRPRGRPRKEPEGHAESRPERPRKKK